MRNFASVIHPDGLYWGQPEITDWLDSARQRELLELETRSWLADLYWGEFLALRFARVRLEHALPTRKKIWERISIDEMNHFSLISKWFADQRVLPENQNLFFRTLSDGLHEVESRPSVEGIARLGELQVFLEALIHKLIEWRTNLVVDSKLKSLLEIISRDELVHIHASLFEANSDEASVSEMQLLTAQRSRLFPLHFARRVLNREEFRRARLAGESIVDRVILKKI